MRIGEKHFGKCYLMCIQSTAHEHFCILSKCGHQGRQILKLHPCAQQCNMSATEQPRQVIVRLQDIL